MKKIRSIIGIIGLLLLAGGIWYARIQAGRHESASERLARFQSEAGALAAKECTNEIPGIRQIINLTVDDYDANYTRWTATAVVDYFNSVGGIDRTNLYFGFSSVMGDLICICYGSYPGAQP